MKIKNSHECGWDLRPVALDMKLVRHGEEVEVDPRVAALLLIQADVWSPVDDDAKKLAKRAIATQARLLAAASAGIPAAMEPSDPIPLSDPPASTDDDPKGA